MDVFDRGPSSVVSRSSGSKSPLVLSGSTTLVLGVCDDFRRLRFGSSDFQPRSIFDVDGRGVTPSVEGWLERDCWENRRAVLKGDVKMGILKV